jgi:hypothetical protein
MGIDLTGGDMDNRRDDIANRKDSNFARKEI